MKRTKRLIAAVIGIVAIIAIFDLTGEAYVTYGKWNSKEVAVYINPQNADVSASAAETAIVSAMSTWSSAGAAFRYLYVGRSNDTTIGYDGRNVMIFRPDGDGSAIARTYSWSSGGAIVDADVIFYDGAFTFFTGTSGCGGSGYGVYIEDAATHELGHALGLLHTTVEGATMYPGYAACTQYKRTLEADDIAGIQALYGSTSSTSSQPPAAPSQLTASPTNNSAISSLTLNWTDNSNNEDGFSIERSADGASFSPIAQLGANSKSYTNSGLPAGTTYYYRVYAYNTGGASGFSNTAAGQTQTLSTTNTAPFVIIGSPANNSSYPQGVATSFSGTASDSQDGSLSSALQWVSSIDGIIGTGPSFSQALSAGTHTITANVSDSGGLSGSAKITFTVTASAQPQTGVTLSARAYKTKGLQYVDLTWSGLSATSVDIYRDGSVITTIPNDGAQTDALNNRGNGTYTYKVCVAGTTSCTNSVTASF